MTYFASFIFDFDGLTNKAIVYKMYGDKLKLIKYKKLDYNPYNDVFFISFLDVHYYYNRILTNMKPQFYYTLPSDEEQWWTFCIRPLYKASSSPITYDNDIVFQLAIEEYLKLTGENKNVEHYIIVHNPFSKSKTAYLVEQLSLDEALNIMKEYEYLVLWESI